MQRRRFIMNLAQCTALGSLGSTAFSSAFTRASAESTKPVVLSYSRLGRTDLQISDVSFGASGLSEGQESLVHYAIERGINYFDTADSYRNGSSERAIGNAIAGRRDRVVVASKGHAGSTESHTSMMQRLEGSLTRLSTDYIDVYFNHAVNDIARLKNPEWSEFISRAKQQGKIRFTGVSGHAGHLVESLTYALSEDMVDVILAAYNFGQNPHFYEHYTRSFDYVARQPGLPQVLQQAEKQDVGIVVMKMERGATLNDMSDYKVSGDTDTQTSIRWALSDPLVDAILFSMNSRAIIDECLGASGWRRVREDAG